MVLTACGPNGASSQAHGTNGGWLDEIDASVVASDSAATELQAGAVDIYSTGLPPSDLSAIKTAGLNVRLLHRYLLRYFV